MQMETLTSAASLDNLNTVIAFIEERADRCGLEAKKKFGLLVAIEEAFVNVCHYAYPETPGEVSLSCGSDDESFVVEISDQGKPFDILSLPDPDTSSAIMDRQIGGLGVFFIRKLTNNVRYRREDGCNILRMVLQQTQEHPS